MQKLYLNMWQEYIILEPEFLSRTPALFTAASAAFRKWFPSISSEAAGLALSLSHTQRRLGSLLRVEWTTGSR